MATDHSGVKIRQARPEDLQDLLEIGDLYGGRDYLVAHYHTYFNNPIIYPLVAEVDGKAVGFYMNHYIDGGRTLIKRTARVHENYRGKGIFHLLSHALDKHREEFWPQVEYEVFGTTTDRADRAAKEFEEKGFVQLVQKRILNMYVRLDDFKGLDVNPKDSSRVTKMTYDDVKLLFSNADAVKRLFPNKVLFNWFLGYKPLESNIRYIVAEDAFVFASTSSLTPLPTAPIDSAAGKSHNFTVDEINDINLLSFAHKHFGRNAMTYSVDLYTTDGYDSSLIKTHLAKHLQDFRQSTNKDGIVFVTFTSSVSEELVVAYLKDLGVVDFIPNMETHTVFFERKL
ncbi:hypothetical protein BsWGS_23368 [Bradybaena similaris]